MNLEVANEQSSIDYLLSPQAVRDRCNGLFNLAEKDQLNHFRYHPEKLPDAAYYVEQVIRANYPTLEIPYHSRWRHFDVGNIDRVKHLQQAWSGVDKLEQGRRLYELGITSVLLDAGAGKDWRYDEATTGQTFTRSEGLAIASFDLYCQGGFSSQKSHPYQADATGLINFGPGALSEAFQVSEENPLLGVSGRSQIMMQLGQVVLENPTIFTDKQPRLGHLLDHFLLQANKQHLAAEQVLKTILQIFGTIWPGRIELSATNLGDCWRHPGLQTTDTTSELIPFHKLSQWLTYSLLEPLQMMGITITNLDALTGLAEYRNGGLFLDLGVISLRDEVETKQAHPVDSLLIVEWRALTIALLDRLSGLIRQNLGLSDSEFPLAKMLQGGTWTAGRLIAKDKRPDGSPPLTIISDGTVF
ncbi:MAG: URC4/urg3 family protein [Chloroflexota bacterium]